MWAVGGLSVACGAILDLKPPPPAAPADAGIPQQTGGDGSEGFDGGSPDASGRPVVCAPLGPSSDGGTTYSSFSAVDDAGSSLWEVFDSSKLARRAGYTGSTFDGRYVYFASRTTFVTRFDTAGAFDATASWSQFDLANLEIPGFVGGFAGAVFDGRYIYFVPYLATAATHPGIVARFDTTGTLSAASSWAWFDTATLPVDGGSIPGGFFGATFDGRYVYFVPRNDGVPDGRVVRYDTISQDAGGLVVADAGNAAFGNLALWETFDLSTTNPAALGYAGAVFDGTSVYFVPAINDAFDASVHNGTSGIVARLKTTTAFTASSSWATFDLTTVNGLAENFLGGAFDGRYVYLAPRGSGIALRLDTRATTFNATSAWSTYDPTQLFVSNAAAAQYAGAAFDGRFIYLVPVGSGFYGLTRYDTQSTFTADCAWSTFDLSQIPMDDGGASSPSYVGAVFDGQYLYLVPGAIDGPMLRFNAKNPAAMPALPAFHGSFL